MTTMTETSSDRLAAFAAPAQLTANAPEWLRSLRERASARFHAAGFPTTRDEEWRFTNLAPLVDTDFALPGDDVAGVTAEDLEPLMIPDLDAATIVFVNGSYAAHLSQIGDLGDGVTVASLSQAIETHGEAIRKQLESLDVDETDALTALNGAHLADGLFVHVQRGKAAARPIQAVYVTTRAATPTMVHPRNLIIAEESAQVTVIEHGVALDVQQPALTNTVTQIEAGDNAVVEHYFLEEESHEAYNISSLEIHQGRDSNVASHTVLLGGRLVRNNVHPVMDGEHCECLINGLYLPTGTQHMDNHMRVEHAQPHGDSRQFYKGVLSDKASAVFSGRIVVAEGAQKTDAKQTNANLLLTDEAQINTKPQLEIYADDVKCTHGATIGQLDRNAIFYLMSRGVPKETARAILTYSFAAEGLFRMKVDAVRRYVERAIAAKLPHGEAINQLI